MKRSLLLFMGSFLFLAISAQAQTAKVKSKSSKATMKDGTGAASMTKTSTDSTRSASATMAMDAPLTATYSSQFEIGDPKNTRMVLDIWKDWDDNKLADHKVYFSDSVVLLTPDGIVLHGIAEVAAGLQKARDKYTASTSTIVAIMPLKSIDKNENWVSVWGTEKDTNKDGSTSTTRLNEVWRINKYGKVDYVEQLYGKVPGNQ